MGEGTLTPCPRLRVCFHPEELARLETADPRLRSLHPAEPAAAAARLAAQHRAHGRRAERLCPAHGREDGGHRDQRPPAPCHQPHAAHTGWRWQAGAAHAAGMQARAPAPLPVCPASGGRGACRDLRISRHSPAGPATVMAQRNSRPAAPTTGLAIVLGCLWFKPTGVCAVTLSWTSPWLGAAATVQGTDCVWSALHRLGGRS